MSLTSTPSGTGKDNPACGTLVSGSQSRRRLTAWPHYRWLIVFCAALAMMMGFGAVSSFAVFMVPLQAEFGWQRADVAFAYTLAALGVAVGGLFWGRLADRFDTRPIVTFGAVAMGGSLLALSGLHDLRTVYGASLALGALGFACLYAPLLATVGSWFDRRRGLAIGLVTAGSAIGSGLVPLLAQTLIDGFGWRDAYSMLGFGYLFGLAPLMVTVTKPDRTRSAAAAGTDVGGWGMKPRTAVSLISAAAFFCCLCMAVPTIHLVSLVIDTGRPASTGARLMMSMMLVGAGARIVFGLIADRIGALRTYLLASSIQTAAVYLLVQVDALELLIAIALVYGFGFAGNNTGFVLSIRESVPARSVGMATAIVSLVAWLGMGAGSFAAGWLYDMSGDYTIAFTAAAAAGLLNITVLLSISRLRARRLRAAAGPVLPSLRAAVG